MKHVWVYLWSYSLYIISGFVKNNILISITLLFAVYNPESSLGIQVQAIMKFVEKHAAELNKVLYNVKCTDMWPLTGKHY